ncbi:hypothetical protein BOX15_Mlig005505g2, partial [Macrostomum lignano]
MTSSIGLLRSVTTLVRLIVIISASLQRSATGEDSARTSGFSIGLRHLRYLIPGGKSVHGYQELSKRSFVPFETSERNLKGSPGQGYCLEMGIGTPPQFSTFSSTRAAAISQWPASLTATSNASSTRISRPPSSGKASPCTCPTPRAAGTATW